MHRWAAGLLSIAVVVSCAHRATTGPRLDAAQAKVLADPTSGEAWLALANAQLGAGDSTSARSSYDRAVRFGATDEALARRIGVDAVALGPGPVTSAHQYALMNPGDDEAWGDLGDYYRDRGDFDTALKHYLYALSLDPGDSEWTSNVAEYGGMDLLMERLDSLAAGATDDEQLGDLGDLARDHGDMDKACELYRMAQQRDRDDSEWRRKVDRCDNGGMGDDTAVDTGAMVGTLSEIVGVGGGFGIIGGSSDTGASSQEVEGWLALARSYALEGRTDDALAQLDKVLDASPGNWEATTTRAILTGRSPLEVQAELAQDADSDEILGDLGDALVAAGRYEEALKAYRQALEKDPSDSEWRNKIDVIAPLLRR